MNNNSSNFRSNTLSIFAILLFIWISALSVSSLKLFAFQSTIEITDIEYLSHIITTAFTWIGLVVLGDLMMPDKESLKKFINRNFLACATLAFSIFITWVFQQTLSNFHLTLLHAMLLFWPFTMLIGWSGLTLHIFPQTTSSPSLIRVAIQGNVRIALIQFNRYGKSDHHLGDLNAPNYFYTLHEDDQTAQMHKSKVAGVALSTISLHPDGDFFSIMSDDADSISEWNAFCKNYNQLYEDYNDQVDLISINID